MSAVRAQVAQAGEIETVLLEALREAREQVVILQRRLGIVETGCGTLSIVDAAIAMAEARS